MDAQAQLIAAAGQVLGPKGVLTDPDEIAPWVSDWRGRVHGASSAILAPASTEEVAAIVRLAAEHRVPLVPQGGNTGMAAGATPAADGSQLLLSLRRMNRIRSLSAENRLAVAEAGVILATLHDTAHDIGMRFPLTLGARGSCTIGGLTSTNAGGTQVLKFGTMRALVAGVEAVLPDGSIHDGLSGLKKDNRGYSVDQLLIGAEGTLGVVTAVALRLVPAIASRAVAWAGVESPMRALDLLRFLEARTSAIEGFELVPEDSLQLVLKHIPGTRPPLSGAHAWHALVEATTADAATDVSAELERLLAAALEQGIIADAAIAANEAQAEALWKIRDSISEAERAEGQTLAHDISVPVADMPRFITEAAAEVERRFPGVIVSGFGHLGDGNIHFH
ncbi:MAG TPA: FAD-binding oxidoreductase, partial [Sphingomicrobium sp.]